MPRISAVIADDERLSREHIRSQLALAWPELEIAGLAANGIEAVSMIETLVPDVAFLDIKMPALSGIEVAARISPACKVVFVTAFDQYAVAAFEREAVDYIIKPTSPKRLAKTVIRVRERLGSPAQDTHLIRLYEQILRGMPGAQPRYLSWIKASVNGAVRLLPVDEVCYFQSSSKYTMVVTKTLEVPIRTPISRLAEELDPERFFQIHRATIVNAACIDKVSATPTSRGQLKLKDRHEILTVSRRFTRIFRQM